LSKIPASFCPKSCIIVSCKCIVFYRNHDYWDRAQIGDFGMKNLIKHVSVPILAGMAIIGYQAISYRQTSENRSQISDFSQPELSLSDSKSNATINRRGARLDRLAEQALQNPEALPASVMPERRSKPVSHVPVTKSDSVGATGSATSIDRPGPAYGQAQVSDYGQYPPNMAQNYPSGGSYYPDYGSSNYGFGQSNSSPTSQISPGHFGSSSSSPATSGGSFLGQAPVEKEKIVFLGGAANPKNNAGPRTFKAPRSRGNNAPEAVQELENGSKTDDGAKPTPGLLDRAVNAAGTARNILATGLAVASDIADLGGYFAALKNWLWPKSKKGAAAGVAPKELSELDGIEVLKKLMPRPSSKSPREPEEEVEPGYDNIGGFPFWKRRARPVSRAPGVVPEPTPQGSSSSAESLEKPKGKEISGKKPSANPTLSSAPIGPNLQSSAEVLNPGVPLSNNVRKSKSILRNKNEQRLQIEASSAKPQVPGTTRSFALESSKRSPLSVEPTSQGSSSPAKSLENPRGPEISGKKPSVNPTLSSEPTPIIPLRSSTKSSTGSSTGTSNPVVPLSNVSKPVTVPRAKLPMLQIEASSAKRQASGTMHIPDSVSGFNAITPPNISFLRSDQNSGTNSASLPEEPSSDAGQQPIIAKKSEIPARAKISSAPSFGVWPNPVSTEPTTALEGVVPSSLNADQVRRNQVDALTTDLEQALRENLNILREEQPLRLNTSLTLPETQTSGRRELRGNNSNVAPINMDAIPSESVEILAQPTNNWLELRPRGGIDLQIERYPVTHEVEFLEQQALPPKASEVLELPGLQSNIDVIAATASPAVQPIKEVVAVAEQQQETPVRPQQSKAKGSFFARTNQRAINPQDLSISQAMRSFGFNPQSQSITPEIQANIERTVRLKMIETGIEALENQIEAPDAENKPERIEAIRTGLEALNAEAKKSDAVIDSRWINVLRRGLQVGALVSMVAPAVLGNLNAPIAAGVEQAALNSVMPNVQVQNPTIPISGEGVGLPQIPADTSISASVARMLEGLRGVQLAR
jgi:hypothetical protein